MGKDKVKPVVPPAGAAAPAPALPPGTRPPKGHKQRGAGTVIVAKPAVVTGDGIVLKAHERLPCQLLQEYCQKEKRSNAKFYPNPPGTKFRCVLHDSKNAKNDLAFAPTQSFASDSVARDFAALLALFHLQRQFPLERRMPEPYASSWLSMIAAEKEQAKLTASDAKTGKAAPGASIATAAAVPSNQSVPAAAAAVAATDASASKLEPPATLSKNSNKNSNSNLAAIAASLNRDTSDWLCDSCSNQNFALLASGQPRVKCFRCGTPKSDTCQLVASSAATVPTTPSTATTSTAPAPAKPPIAAVNLLVGKNATYVSKADEERAVQEKRALQKRKQYYFDALRRANRPHIVHIPTALRVKLERLLGIATAGSSDDVSEELSLEEVLQTYQESGLFPPDLCNMSIEQQTGILQRVSKHLLGQGFAVQYVASSLREVLLQNASDLLDDAIDTTETGAESTNTVLDGRKVSATFEKLLSEACLKNLCMTVEESELPEAYNPKFYESSKKLSVVTAPSTAPLSTAVASTKKTAQDTSSACSVVNNSGGAEAEGASADAVARAEAELSVDPELRTVLLQLFAHCNCLATTTTNSTSNASAAVVTQQDCITALLTASSVLSSIDPHCTGGDAHDSKLLFLALLILQEASLSTPGSCELSPALQQLRCCAEKNDAVSADFTEVNDEIESLQAIFEDNVLHARVTESVLEHCVVTLKVTLDHLQRAKQSRHVLKTVSGLKLTIIVHQLSPYPAHAPLIYLHSDEGKLSAGAAAAVCELQSQLRAKAAKFSGELMIFQLYSYLQECIDNIATTGGGSSPTDQSGGPADCSVSGNLPLISAYLTGNDALYDSLVQERSVSNSSDIAVTAVDPTVTASTRAAVSEAKTATDASDSNTVTTAASESTISSTAPTKATNSRKGPHMHSFWSPISSQDSTKSANSSVTQSKAMLESRRKLPSWSKREEVINLVQNNRAIVVTGETGCGKTTQVPQFLYETNPQQKIVICQPRRLAAVGVATRVAEEVGCVVGQEVGYMVKGDSQTSARTRIAFCTYGVLLRRLQDDPTLSAISTIILDEVHERGMDSDFTLALLMFALSRRTDLKIILMSATISTDHFASYLGKWLSTGSGTTAIPAPVPVMFIPGYTFPVVEHYKGEYEETVRRFRDFTPAGRQQDMDYDDMDTADSSSATGGGNNYYIGGYPRKGEIDYDLLTRLIMVLARSAGDSEEMYARAHGSILVFMPGVPEISKLARLLQTHWRDSSSNNNEIAGNSTVPRLKIMPLHGNLSPSEQKMVFTDAKRGELKVVIATNVAEASVTIPDVTVVIDTCRVKEMSFDAEIQTAALMTKFAAKDSLRQRKGRAGRVQKGRCFRLITKGTFEKLPEHSVPEILRVPLEKIVLQVKAMLSANTSLFDTHSGAKSGAKSGGKSGAGTSAAVNNKSAKESAAAAVSDNNTMTLLCRCPDVPTEVSVTAAELLLTQIQALDASTGALTPLGRHLSTLPCMPRVGRLAIFGALLGCVYAATAVAAGMTVRSPFISSQDAEVIRAVNAAKDQFSGGSALRSDYTLLVNILKEFEAVKNKRSFCKQYGLSMERMNEIHDTQRDLLTGLVDIGLLRSVQEGIRLPALPAGISGASAVNTDGVNRNAHKSRLVAATLCAGIYPQLAKILRPTRRFVEVAGGAVERDLQAKELKFYIPLSAADGSNSGNGAASVSTASAVAGAKSADKAVDKRNIDICTDDQMRVFINPSSSNFSNSSFKESNFIMYGERQLVSYHNATTGVPDTKVYLRDTTEASAFALLFFGGKLETDYCDGTVTVDGWIRFTAPGRIVAIIQEIRHAFDGILQTKFESPSTDISAMPVVDLACQLLDLNAQY